MTTSKKLYGLNIKARPTTAKPVPMALDDSAGERVVLAAARRVIARHKKVIKALADR